MTTARTYNVDIEDLVPGDRVLTGTGKIVAVESVEHWNYAYESFVVYFRSLRTPTTYLPGKVLQVVEVVR